MRYKEIKSEKLGYCYVILKLSWDLTGELNRRDILAISASSVRSRSGSLKKKGLHFRSHRQRGGLTPKPFPPRAYATDRR